jgi:hypothetical protein
MLRVPEPVQGCFSAACCGFLFHGNNHSSSNENLGDRSNMEYVVLIIGGSLNDRVSSCLDRPDVVLRRLAAVCSSDGNRRCMSATLFQYELYLFFEFCIE